MNTKKIISISINLILVGFIGKTLWTRYEVSQSQKPLLDKSVSVQGLIDTQGQAVELDDKPKAVIFWATWCQPCTAELARIRSAIEDGELKAESILAIAVWDNLDDVAKVVKDRSYNFPVMIDSKNSASAKFKVSATPTTAFLASNRVIKEISTGLSLMPATAINGFLASEEAL